LGEMAMPMLSAVTEAMLLVLCLFFIFLFLVWQ